MELKHGIFWLTVISHVDIFTDIFAYIVSIGIFHLGNSTLICNQTSIYP